MIYTARIFLALVLLFNVCQAFQFVNTLAGSKVFSGVRLNKNELLMSSEVDSFKATDLFIPQSQRGDLNRYCESVTATKRRPTRTVWAGDVPIGSEHPIALQTMTTTDTRDVQATVEQVIKCADAGADLVRITVQGTLEAKACQEIKNELVKRGYNTPLVADIHFNPKVAMMVAEAFEKIRVNPGNFADGRKKFEDMVYDDEASFLEGLEEIEKTFTPLVLKCKELGRAMRIGTNHGSLSARIMSYYGDTPRGMVESALEFANICRKHDYHNFVFSMKASNPLVMAQAYRLLAAEMYRLGWDYPLHLGVTEAGEGEDGRMKSAIGIGSLLLDGLGDTIRVSLTEDPEYELAPCGLLAEVGRSAANDQVAAQQAVPTFEEEGRSFETFTRRSGDLPEQLEDDKVDLRYILHRDGSVITPVSASDLETPDKLYKDIGCKTAVGMPFKDIATSDSIYLKDGVPAEDNTEARTALRRLQEVSVGVLVDIEKLEASPLPNAVAVISLEEAAARGGKVDLPKGAARLAVTTSGAESDEAMEVLKTLSPAPVMLLLKCPEGVSRLHASRRLFTFLGQNQIATPVIHSLQFDGEVSTDEFLIKSGCGAGSLLVDGLGDGVMIDAPSSAFSMEVVRKTSFGLLQGSRMRNTKTEYVSCPSCGRTLFDLQEVTRNIQNQTGHLPGVSIAVMGCIVNGVGEMADADFGYVGGAPGKVDLYVGKEVVQRGIPNEEACDALVELIKENGRWVEPAPEEEEEAPVAAAV